MTSLDASASGTGAIDHLEENLAAAALELTADERVTLDGARGH